MNPPLSFRKTTTISENLGNEFAFHNDFETHRQNTTEKSYIVFGRGK